MGPSTAAFRVGVCARCDGELEGAVAVGVCSACRLARLPIELRDVVLGSEVRS